MLKETRGRSLEIELGGRRLTYRVTSSRSATRARISVGPRGVDVVLPSNRAASSAISFLEENADWVLAQLDATERISGFRREPTKRKPNVLLFRGAEVKVEVIRRGDGSRHPVCSFADGRLVVSARNIRRRDLSAAIERWLRREARSAILPRVAALAKCVGREPGQVFIRGQKTKWGNCSAAGNLSFNWRLVMAPPRVLDAIVIHELAHLVEPSHRTKFWLIVRSHCPDYARTVSWLRENEAGLFAPLNIAHDP